MTWISKIDKGAASELIASAYLMQSGYSVFRCVSASAPFDLVAYKDEECIRVEVKSIYVAPTGPSFPWPVNIHWDMLLLVDTESFRVYEFGVHTHHSITNSLRKLYGFDPCHT